MGHREEQGRGNASGEDPQTNQPHTSAQNRAGSERLGLITFTFTSVFKSSIQDLNTNFQAPKPVPFPMRSG